MIPASGDSFALLFPRPTFLVFNRRFRRKAPTASTFKRAMAFDVSQVEASHLPDDPGLCHQMIRELLQSLRTSEREKEQLRYRLDQLLRARFGPRSEKIDPAQLKLFAAEVLELAESQASNEASSEESPPADSSSSSGNEKKKRPGHGRKPLPRDLPRRRLEHTLPEAALACPCCGERRTKIGEDVSEQLDYVPASLQVIEHARFKYACPHCEGEVVIADKPRQPIEKGLAAPGLLAQTIVSKFGDHLPLYRLERIFKRHGVEIPRSTMCGWMADCAELLAPLYKLMCRRIRESRIVHTDDTPVRVQDKNRKGTRQGRFWVYIGDHDHAYTVFDYTPTRQRDGPMRWLASFEGYLQADAFAGYDGIYARGGGNKVVEVACWAHARRKFYDARTVDPSRSHAALAWVRKLYDVEDAAKVLAAEEGSSPDEEHSRLCDARYRLRQEQAVPLLASFGEWLEKEATAVLPKSPIGQAIGYALSNWEALKRYTQDGELDIDNNASENALRGIALGRKNWMFLGSNRDGRTAAILFSFMATCHRRDVEPFAYLRDVLGRISDHPMSRIEELLPGRWRRSEEAAALQVR